MLARLAVILALLGAAIPAWAQGLLRDDFEGPEPSLRQSGGDAAYKVEAHLRVQQGAHSGRWCEFLKIAGNNGTCAYFSRPIGTARVISELAPKVWLKADRGGLQIMAHVVLPRSTDPGSGKPLTTLVRGSDYQQVGVWQQLRIDNLPLLLERQVRVLRTQFGPGVDSREAYVDRILLNVYGGPGITNVWVDDLEVTGVVPSESAESTAAAETGPGGPMPAAPIARLTSLGSRGASRVELKSSLLMVDGKPFFPRAVEYRGEPLARLKSLGFNAIHLTQSPTQGLLDEAAGLGLWLIAPPPPARQLESRSADTPDTKIGPQFDPVLVWDLGSGLARSELEATRRWAKLVQAADPRQRPLLCAADAELRDYTRFVNLLMARRDPLGTTLSLKNYMDWLRDRSQLARGGTPLWVTIQTEPAPRLLEQLSLLSPRTAPIGLQESQIRTLVHAALASRVRGICFASGSRLDASDMATQRRAAILELVNLELHLIDRWAAAGNSATNASTNDPSVSGAVIETDRSRLLLPIYAPPGGQFVMGNSTVPKLSFKLLGVPEGNNAYELSLTSFRPLACQ